MKFEWNDRKATRNARLHGVDFEEARTTFYDSLAREQVDDAHSDSEHRWMLIGMSRRGRLLVTVFTERKDTVRIITSRRATRREVRAYEERI